MPVPDERQQKSLKAAGRGALIALSRAEHPRSKLPLAQAEALYRRRLGVQLTCGGPLALEAPVWLAMHAGLWIQPPTANPTGVAEAASAGLTRGALLYAMRRSQWEAGVEAVARSCVSAVQREDASSSLGGSVQQAAARRIVHAIDERASERASLSGDGVGGLTSPELPEVLAAAGVGPSLTDGDYSSTDVRLAVATEWAVELMDAAGHGNDLNDLGGFGASGILAPGRSSPAASSGM